MGNIASLAQSMADHGAEIGHRRGRSGQLLARGLAVVSAPSSPGTTLACLRGSDLTGCDTPARDSALRASNCCRRSLRKRPRVCTIGIPFEIRPRQPS
jgi:hypothetical protein